MVANSGGMVSFYGLKVGIRYACMRTQFTLAKSTEEQALLDYQLHQHRLFPYIAKTMGNQMACLFIRELWASSLKNLFKPKNFKLQQIHSMISVIKPLSTWNAFKSLQEVREACGGLGFSYYARVAELRQYYDVNQTWEGDNNVLLQQTAKFLLELYQ